MHDLSLNARFILWKQDVPRAEWASKLSALLGWSEATAESFLVRSSTVLSAKEAAALARFGGVSEADLASKDLLVAAKLDLFHENISFLMDLLPHGEKKRFADKLGVDATTISRWRNGTQKPTRRKLPVIVRQFGLPDGTNLLVEPVFLSAGPIGVEEMRNWLHARIEKTDGDVLRGLFPAFARLLKTC